MMINVALTGSVPRKKDTPALPVTPSEIIADAVVCADAGAAIVHIHVRDDQGRPVHDRARYREVVYGIREQRPELIICLTTSGRVAGDAESRFIPLDLGADCTPDMASCSLGSFNFATSVSHNPPKMIDRLLAGMLEAGIKPELEVFEQGMVNSAHSLLERGLLKPPLYVNVLLGSMGSAPAFAADLAHIVDRLPAGTTWAGAGIGVFQKPVVALAAAMGGNVRIGLEDAPRAIDGTPNTNLGALQHAVAQAQILDRRVAGVATARAWLGLQRQEPDVRASS